MEICSAVRVGELRQERVADRLGLARHQRGIAEAQMHDGRHLQALERAVDGLDRDALGGIGIVAQPRLVELDDVGAGGYQVVRLRVHGDGVVHHHLVVVLVELVVAPAGSW